MSMKYPKKFEDWFNKYGMMDDSWQSLEPWQRERIKRIAYRAYRRGQMDRSTAIGKSLERACTNAR